MDFSLGQILSTIYSALKKNKADLIGYNVTPLPYNTSCQVNLLKPCNGWTVINQGKTTTVTVNGTVVLPPGGFIAVGGNEGEEYVGFLQLLFASNTNPDNNALVIQKFYTGGPAYDKIGL